MNKVLSEPLDEIIVNPFVNHWTWTQWESIRVYTIGALMIIARLIPFLVFVLLSSFYATGAMALIDFLSRFDYNTEGIRVRSRYVVFTLMRIALFFVGFYYIKVNDMRRDKTRMANIIPVAPHSSFFDMVISMMLVNPTFVSRAENLNTPLFCNILRLCKGIYVDRAHKDSRQKTISDIIERANNGEQVLIYPEGTCTNRSTLVEFKLGAFIPKLPVQPVLVRWDAGQNDSVTWTWEGPSMLVIFLHALTRISTNCEITILPQYVPSEEEKASPKMYAENVSRMMCTQLGVLQSFYSYDDAPLILAAKNCRLFRSPACIMILKLCSLLHKKKPNLLSKGLNEPMPKHKKRNLRKGDGSVLEPTNSMLLCCGEDVEHVSQIAEVYTPKHFRNEGNKSKLKEFLKNVQSPPIRTKSDASIGEYENLSVSGTQRKCINLDQVKAPQGLNEEIKQIYKILCKLIEHCISNLENNFVVRPIISSDDVIRLLDLQAFLGDDDTLNSLKCTSTFVNLVKIMEFNVNTPITTFHLLIILHLCDIREKNLWERIRVAMRLFQLHRFSTSATATSSCEKANLPKENPEISFEQFRTLLWYVLGIQEFNDHYFIQSEFDYEYLREHLPRQFRRAVIDNGCQLVDEPMPSN